jgi:D-alanyl-D-alanine carboxypeptidase
MFAIATSLSCRGAQRRGTCFFFCSAAARIALLFLPFAIAPPTTHAQQNSTLAASVQKIIDRPEFKHANFGIEFYDLASNTVVYSLNPDKLFTPASTTKLLTEGTVLAKFGKDYRFHTAIYRTGPIDKKGRLKGDLILVASGDPNLSP